MKVAQKRNAVLEGMFYFRKDIFKGESPTASAAGQCPRRLGPQTGLLCPPGCNPVLDGSGSAQNGLEGECANEEYTLMSIDNIINGKVTYLLIESPLIRWVYAETP